LRLAGGAGFIGGVEVFALDVFNQREFEFGLSVGDDIAHDARHFGQARELCGAQAALAGDQRIGVMRGGFSGVLAHDERLDDAVLFDRGGQFIEAIVDKRLAGLVGVGDDVADGNVVGLVHADFS